MKLKEKLAGDFATWIRHPLNAAGETKEEKHFNQARYLGFLAGFEKAREMAIQDILKQIKMEPKDTAFYKIIATAAYSLEEIGEQEVNESHG